MSRTICVTGSAGGLGRALAGLLSDQGDRVIGVDVVDADVVADLSTADGRAAAVDAVRAHADGAIDGLVAAAGLGPQVGDGARIGSVNYFGAVAFLDGTVDLLAAGDTPAAVAISSNSATQTPADADLVDAFLSGDEARARERAAQTHPAVVYGTSKRALAIAVRRRVRSWGERGVRLNAVAPGAFDTPLLRGGLEDPELGPLIESQPIPLGPIPGPADVASVVAFLLSGAARHVHGSVLFVDGGTDALIAPDRVP